MLAIFCLLLTGLKLNVTFENLTVGVHCSNCTIYRNYTLKLLYLPPICLDRPHYHVLQASFRKSLPIDHTNCMFSIKMSPNLECLKWQPTSLIWATCTRYSFSIEHDAPPHLPAGPQWHKPNTLLLAGGLLCTTSCVWSLQSVSSVWYYLCICSTWACRWQHLIYLNKLDRFCRGHRHGR